MYDIELGDMQQVETEEDVAEEMVADEKRACEEFNDEAHGNACDKSTDKTTTTTPPAFAFVVLGVSVVALSLKGVFLRYQAGSSSSIKMVWRHFCAVLLFLPPLAVDIIRRGFPRLSRQEWSSFVLMGTCGAVWLLAFAVSIDFTSVGNAVILSNCQSVLLFVGKFFVGSHFPSLLEGFGGIVAFAGAVLCSLDVASAAPHEHRQESPFPFFGDMVALLSGLGGLGYLLLAKPLLESQMSLVFFVTLNLFMRTVLMAIFVVVALGENMTFDADRDTGLFGWMRLEMDRLPLQLVIVLICDIVGTLGLFGAMKWFSTFNVSVTILMQPVIATVATFCLGVGALPQLLGWIGNVLVPAGAVAVVWPTATDEEELSDETEEAKPKQHGTEASNQGRIPPRERVDTELESTSCPNDDISL